MVDPLPLTRAPEPLLALAADLLLRVTGRAGGEYLDLLDRTQPPIPPDSRLEVRLAAMRSRRCALTGEIDKGVRHALAARGIATLAGLDDDEWIAALLTILLRGYTYLEDFDAVDREAAAALAMPPSPSRSSW